MFQYVKCNVAQTFAVRMALPPWIIHDIAQLGAINSAPHHLSQARASSGDSSVIRTATHVCPKRRAPHTSVCSGPKFSFFALVSLQRKCMGRQRRASAAGGCLYSETAAAPAAIAKAKAAKARNILIGRAPRAGIVCLRLGRAGCDRDHKKPYCAVAD